jgi:hypothetical protein
MAKEARMVELCQEALARQGIEDEVVAAGQFFPRGHTGAGFTAGMAGGELGGVLGRVGEDVGLAAGVIGGQRAHDAASGLPERMLIAVSDAAVYGFDTHREHGREPTDLIFQLPRSGLQARVHPRVNVRVVELIDEASGSAVELEGERLPGFGVSDVIDALRA